MTGAYLADTHIALWALLDDPKLSQEARSILEDESNRILISAASIWEIAMKHAKSPDCMPISAREFAASLEIAGFEFLDIDSDDLLELERLNLSSLGIHRDPFDRLLIAQASRRKARLLTHDERIREYPLPWIVGV